MIACTPTFTTLSDADLLAQVTRLAAGERHATVQLIAALMELDARRLYLGQGCSSLFTYCTQVLHLSEHAAYGRIEAARAARRFPVILDGLADGSLTLTTVGLLAPHLTPGNHGEVLDAARHARKRDVEVLVARLRPQPAVAASVRKLPVATAAPTAPSPSSPSSPTDPTGSSPSAARTPQEPMPATLRAPRPSVVAPVAPELYKVQMTVGRETMEKLRRVQDLLRHAVPTGDLSVILDRALTLLLAHVERTRVAATASPRKGRELVPGSRHIPSAVRRAVWKRDEGRCSFVGAAGRCTERGFLELHHVVPYAVGGEATVDTIALRCRAHNLYEAELDFGPRVHQGPKAQARASAPDGMPGERSSGQTRPSQDRERTQSARRSESARSVELATGMA